MQNVGVHAVVTIITYLITIAFSFRAVKALKIDNIIKSDHVFEAQVFLLFLAIALGFMVGGFVMMLIDNSLALRFLFF